MAKNNPRPASSPSRISGAASTLFRFSWRAALGVLVLLALWAAYLDAVVTRTFEAHRWTVPSRVYARPLDLYAGKPLTAGALLAELRELGYREVTTPAAPGQFAVSDGGLVVRLVTRGFAFPEGVTRPQVATARFSAARLEVLTAGDRVLRLEPVVIGAIRPRQTEDRLLMRLAERPPYLAEALFTVEDQDFPDHFGISLRGILRALYVNLAAGQVQQGGSTLTQQLVKNFYLDSERTITRKLTEMVMAVLLEVHYDKNTILETYLNEIFLAQSGSRAVHGFALASEYYFGRPVGELNLHEVALLVGLVKGPSQYNPWKNPERALARRNLVLDMMASAGIVDAATAGAARAQSLGVVPAPRLRVNRYPAYLSLVRAELRERLDEDKLAQQGLSVFSSLDPGAQLAAEAAVVDTLARLEQQHAVSGLEAALVVASPQTGEIEAAVGGRDVDFAGFNRVADARRSIGSLMKPVVFLAALSRPQQYSLASWVSDAPVEAAARGGPSWRPANYDRISHGEPPDHNVMLIDALSHSWNQATARLGLTLGVDTVLAQTRALGVTADLPPYPSVMLGTATLSPLEVLGLYQPLASGGLRLQPRAVRGVLDANGQVLLVRSTRTERVVTPATAFLLTHALQDVFRNGTARSAYDVLPTALNAAGKTGTTDDSRDSWFAGYTANHLAVAWIGRDDNRPTPLSGASGALRLWADFSGRLPQVSLPAVAPAGVEWAWLMPGGREQGAEGCSGARLLPVIAGTVPAEVAACGRLAPVVDGVKGFFRKLFD